MAGPDVMSDCDKSELLHTVSIFCWFNPWPIVYVTQGDFLIQGKSFVASISLKAFACFHPIDNWKFNLCFRKKSFGSTSDLFVSTEKSGANYALTFIFASSQTKANFPISFSNRTSSHNSPFVPRVSFLLSYLAKASFCFDPDTRERILSPKRLHTFITWDEAKLSFMAVHN